MERTALVLLETALGGIEIMLHIEQAPRSVAAFTTHVETGRFDHAAGFYRAVRAAENDRGSPPVDLIQGGIFEPPASLPTILHEATSFTGLRHLDGTVSLARGAPGTATGASFFICIGDQPALDAGGGRDPFGDGQGFAAFGRVVRGMDVVRQIHRLPTGRKAADQYLQGQLLDPCVCFTKASRRSSSSIPPDLNTDGHRA